MKISLIAAVADNGVIGKDNSLIWHLPADMKFFKHKTHGHCILTGRKNYESIPEKFRPLSNRTNIVVTTSGQNYGEKVLVADTIEKAIDLARTAGEQELFIIGGGQIYEQTINLADRLYITWVHSVFEGDTKFPIIGPEWKTVASERRPADEKNAYDMTFEIYEKRNMIETEFMGIKLKKIPAENGQFQYMVNDKKVTVWTLSGKTLTIME